MRKIFTILSVVCCIHSLAMSQSVIQPVLWGNLEKGAYSVGFKTILLYDRSRPSVAHAETNGQMQISGSSNGRQMQMCVWYPAKKTPRPTMLFQEYVHEIAHETNFLPFTPERKKDAERIFYEQVQDLGGDSAAIRQAFPKVFAMQTAAVRNAPEVAEKFPLIIYPNWRTPAVENILCEYLASHGYVIVTIPMKGTTSSAPEISLQGIETAVNDIQFTIGVLSASPNVDRNNIALAGTGINASIAIAAQSRNTLIRAVASIEGGILSSSDDALLRQTPYFDLAAIRVPILAIYAPHPSISPERISDWKYSTRYFVHFPFMSEFHCLNYGMLERFVPNILGKPPGDVVTGYEWVCRYSRQFFDAILKNSTHAQAFLSRNPEQNGIPQGLVQTTIRQALSPPPTLTEVKNMIATRGIESFRAVYRRYKTQDSTPFSQQYYVDLINWLSWKRDPTWNHRKVVAQCRVWDYPQSARAHFTFANAALKTNDSAIAQAEFAEALSLSGSDSDALLTENLRTRIKEISTNILRQLAPKEAIGNGIISTSEWHEGVTELAKNGNEMYLTRSDEKFHGTLMISRREKDRWTIPIAAAFSGKHSDAGASLNSTDSILYFTSSRRTPYQHISDEWNLWRMHKTLSGWSEPKALSAPINTPRSECCAVAKAKNALYFSSDRSGVWEMYRAEIIGDSTGKIERLSDAVNSSKNGQWPSYVDSAETILLFSSIRGGGFGGDDIYVSFRREGKWTEAENIGALVNTDGYEDSAILAPDGQYLWYSSRSNQNTKDSTANVYRIPIALLPRIKKHLSERTP